MFQFSLAFVLLIGAVRHVKSARFNKNTNILVKKLEKVFKKT